MRMNSKRFHPAETALQAPTETALVRLIDRPEYAGLFAELEKDEKFLEKTEKERRRLLARASGKTTNRTAAEQMADLLRGGRVDPIPPGLALDAVDKELKICRQSIWEKTQALDAISADLSHAEGQRFKSAFNAAQVRAFEHLEQAVAAFAEGEGIADRLRKAGYRVSSVTMPDLMPPGIRALAMTELQRFRRALVQLGAI